MTHTPGPWEVYPSSNFYGVYEVHPAGEMDEWEDTEAAAETDDANARLIAEAPAMLEALKWIDDIPLCAFCDNPDGHDDDCPTATIRAIIDRIEGTE